jgi:predicted acyltransferase
MTITKRADALDALRGLAILGMVFSGTIRFEILPAWMYHAQVPPPDHQFNPELAGLTWVDLVFPLFLFVMGAAIPLALSRRIAQGWSIPRVILEIGKRFFLLASFAIVLQHFRPFTINATPTNQTWWIALLCFFILFLMYGRFPKEWRLKKLELGLMVVGWISAIALLSHFQYDGKGFSLERSDIILIVLANMAFFGSLIWLLTRSHPSIRWGILGFLIALQLSATAPGWVQQVWDASPIPWLFRFDYLKYLFIVIPGMMAGDWLLNWIQRGDDNTHSGNSHENIHENIHENAHWTHSRYAMILLSMIMIIVILLIGLQARWVWQTSFLSAGLGAIASLLFKHPTDKTESLFQKFYQWGLYWLFLGLCFEPFQEGIKKDSATYSYYFITTAIAFFLLISFMILIDIFQQKKWVQLLIDNGKNPMIAYVSFANFIWPITNLTQWEDWIVENTQTPITGVLKGLGSTLAIALIVSLITRLKLFWKT